MTGFITGQLSNYIREKGIKISVIARETGLSDGILRRCLSQNERDLRADEFLKICDFLNIDPRQLKNDTDRNTLT